MHTWLLQTLSNERRINYFVVSAKNPTLFTMLWMTKRVLNYYLFCRNKRLDPHRIHAGYKKWQCFSAPAASQLCSGIRHNKVNPTWSSWRCCMDCSRAKNVENYWSSGSMPSFSIISVYKFIHGNCNWRYLNSLDIANTLEWPSLFCLQQIGNCSKIGSLLQIVKNTF